MSNVHHQCNSINDGKVQWCLKSDIEHVFCNTSKKINFIRLRRNLSEDKCQTKIQCNLSLAITPLVGYLIYFISETLVTCSSNLHLLFLSEVISFLWHLKNVFLQIRLFLM